MENQKILNELYKLKNPAKAKLLERFFKCEKGEYGEGDKFLGIVVPQQREVVRKYYENISLDEIEKLLPNKFHEARLTALLMLVGKFGKADEKTRNQIYKLYLKNAKYINNWDLVDLSAPKIVGGYLLDKDRKIEFEVASEDTNLFVKQIMWCNIVYIRGGSSPTLQDYFEKVANLNELLSGKIVAGSSAGALVFAKYYYDQDYDKIFKGLNFLPVKIITHYLSTGEYAATSGRSKLKLLEDYKEKLPVYAIPEMEYVIVEKDL